MMWKLIAAIGLSMFVSVDDARAQQAPVVPEPTATVLETVSAQSLSDLLKENGFQDVTVQPTGSGIIFTRPDDGHPFLVHLYGCSRQIEGQIGCVQISIFTFLKGKLPVESVNRFNSDAERFARAVRVRDDMLAFVRPFMVAGGVTKKNVTFNIVTFVGTLNENVADLARGTVANATTERPHQLVLVPPSPSEMAALLSYEHATDIFESLRKK